MKKLLSLLLVGVMLVSLCGCFSEPEDVRGDITANTTTSATTSTNEFSLGKTANNVYENKFLGLSCTLPSDWTFATDDEILELNSMVAGTIDEDIASRIKEANIIYDMQAANSTTGSSMNINLEKLSLVQVATLDIKQTLEAQISQIETAYANMGYTNTVCTYKKVTVDGKSLDALEISAKIQGVDFYAVAFAFAKENYLANVTVCSLVDNTIDTLLGYFDFA
ncbi:MAG: hypothetical protein IJN65_02055 [Clostridia bacterium]|nr:hypothetical protein [Clostridia bacterium]